MFYIYIYLTKLFSLSDSTTIGTVFPRFIFGRDAENFTGDVWSSSGN